MEKSLITKERRGPQLQKPDSSQQGTQWKILVEMIKKTARPLGAPLEEKIHPNHPGKGDHQVELPDP
jgi:hypothetical protein